MMTADSENNVFGRTLNPNNTSLTAGGSTGGEGALIALRGSILGVGTDIGGSVRIPSMSCGIYGMKPTSTVFPYTGQASPGAPGSAAFAASAGPMATSMRACRFLLQSVVKAEPWKFDFGCDRLPWVGNDEKISSSKLRVGYVEDDGNYTIWPPMARALKRSVEKLEAAGVTIVPITLPVVKEIVENSISYFLLDGGKVLHPALKPHTNIQTHTNSHFES
jgi:amidase